VLPLAVPAKRFSEHWSDSLPEQITVATAVIFMLTSLTLALLMGRGASSSLMKGVNVPAATQPAESPAPAGTPAPPASESK